jgi:7,8-dihydroneopterin aldolase/epimerase/oxygenase
MTDRIFLRGMRFFARHGVFEEEARLGQTFEVDLECLLDMRFYSRTDDAAAAVRYDHLFDTVRDVVVSGERVGLIETLGERIAEAVLGRFARLDQVRVVVRKPAAPIDGMFDTLGIEITRGRNAATGE